MIWMIFGIIFFAGAVGGIINALLTDNGFVFPSFESASGTKIWRPGIIGNLLIGAISAIISWGLYGPFASLIILPHAANTNPNISVAAFVGAMLVGIAGAKWLSNEVDKKLLKATAVAAAAGTATPESPAAISAATPAKALEIAQSLNK